MARKRRELRNLSTTAVRGVTVRKNYVSERPAKRLKAQPGASLNSTLDTEDSNNALEAKRRKEPQRSQKSVPQVGNETPLKLFERVQSPWKVGAHVSAAGGVENAIVAAAQIGANAFALFLKTQRKWESKPLSEESIQSFKERMVEFGYDAHLILPHGNYLVNLGNPDAAMREKSYQCFVEELKRCELLGLKYFNFHPGSTVNKTTPEQSITYIAESINRAHKETKSVVTVIENMAGQGNVIGGTFAQIRQIIDQVQDKSRVGVCLDTCHMFAAGYDIRTAETWNQSMADFEKEIGIKYLCGMHLNDSKCALASKKDRHENIGLGNIGLVGFSQIITDPRVQNIPLILETPSYEQPSLTWKHEIDILNRISLHSLPRDQNSTQSADGHEDSLKGIFDGPGGEQRLDTVLGEVKAAVARAQNGVKAKATAKAQGKKVSKSGEGNGEAYEQLDDEILASVEKKDGKNKQLDEDGDDHHEQLENDGSDRLAAKGKGKAANATKSGTVARRGRKRKADDDD